MLVYQTITYELRATQLQFDYLVYGRKRTIVSGDYNQQTSQGGCIWLQGYLRDEWV